MSDKYSIIECGQPADLEKYKSCFDNNNDSKQYENLEWMHFQNPVKKCYVDFAIENTSEEVGGLYAVFPVKFKCFSELLLGAQSIDTLVDKHHRKQGLFKKLAKSLYQRCEEEGLKFVYGFPMLILLLLFLID